MPECVIGEFELKEGAKVLHQLSACSANVPGPFSTVSPPAYDIKCEISRVCPLRGSGDSTTSDGFVLVSRPFIRAFN